MDNKDKSLEELRAAITQDQENTDSPDDSGTPNDAKSEDQDASTDEGTSKEASADDSAEGTSEDQEEWIVPGRFRTKEDVVKAYQELESFAGRQSSEMQRLRSSITEAPRRGELPEEKAARLKRFADELAEDPEAALVARMRSVVSEVKGDVKASEFKRAYESRKSDPNSDFAKLEPTMTQIAIDYQDMIVQNGMENDPRLLDILHLAAKGLEAANAVRKAEAKGAKKGEEIARQKKKARLEGPSGNSKGKKRDTSNLSAAEMKALFAKGELDVNE